ncbi:MAG: cellulase family glycosylhydrolase [Thermogutta sp.]
MSNERTIEFVKILSILLTWVFIAALVWPLSSFPGNNPKSAFALFPFVVPVDDVSGGITDMSFLNDRPADQPVTIRDGHFYAGDKRIRFWGMNTSFQSNYPAHDQETVVAKRFAKLGMNMVRITYTDWLYAPRGLFDPAFPGEMRINPEQMEKLDYFIAQLKEHGIYVELSLHVNHLKMMDNKGVPELGSRRYGFGSGMPLWNKRFIEAKKQYARDFFGHVNQYTGKPYTEEPAVAMLEIMNENQAFVHGDRLRGEYRHGLERGQGVRRRPVGPATCPLRGNPARSRYQNEPSERMGSRPTRSTYRSNRA